MRDIETVEAALALSETGHLFWEIHTNSAVQTISRIISMFPSDHRSHIRVQLAFVRRRFSQQLIPKVGGG